MEWLKRLSQMEPAVLRGALLSIATFLALLGFGDWATESNVDIIVNLVFSVMPLITGFVVRPAVTPNAKVGAEAVNPEGPLVYEAGEAAIYDEGTPVDVVLEDSPETRGRDDLEK